MRLESGSCVAELVLFQNVRNAEGVKQMLIECRLDTAMLEAELILDPFQIQISLTCALEKYSQNALTCRNLNTEIMYNISGHRNITKALKTFGITNTTTYLLAVVAHPSEEKISQIRCAVDGIEVPNVLQHLAQHANRQRIQHIYGIRNEELHSSSLIDSIATRISCRDVH